MSHRIFMTGARGFLGRNLLQAAARQLPRARFVLLARSAQAVEDLASQFAWINSDRLDIVQGDILRPGLGLSRADASMLVSTSEVWHLAASTSFDDREKHAIYESNVAGTRNVLSAVRGLKRLERLVYVSTAYVAGTNPGPIAEDEMPPRNGFRNSYEASKWEAEQTVRQSGLPFTIFRPSIIMGDSRTFDSQGERRMIYGYLLGIFYSVLRECRRKGIDFIQRWHRGKGLDLDLRLLGNQRTTKNFVCINDVTASMLHILQRPCMMKSFHLTSAEPTDGMTLWRCIAKALRINGLSFVGDKIEAPTALEKNVMSYTTALVPYTLAADPVWLLTNTNQAMGPHHPRIPMSEAMLLGLMEHFMRKELAAQQAPAPAGLDAAMATHPRWARAKSHSEDLNAQRATYVRAG